jgi:poly-gamma-glutamate synthesis protein (capsule biosynthesis protein)
MIGATFILLALAGCQAGGEGLNANVFSSGVRFGEVMTESEVAKSTDKTGEQTTVIYVEPPRTAGGIVSFDTMKAEQFIDTIEGAERYGVVAVIAGTSHTADDAKVFTYGAAGVLEKKGIAIDEDAVGRLVASGMVRDLGAVGEESAWNGPVADLLRDRFPKAHFVFISVNDAITPETLNTAAYALHTSLEEDVLMLAIEDFVFSENTKIAAFQNAFTDTVLRNFDVERFDELPVGSPPAAKAAALFLRYRGVGKLGRFSDDAGVKQVLYGKGKTENDSDGPLYLVAFGDVMLGRYVRTLMERNTNDYPFELADERYLRVNDLLLANLEGPIAEKAISTSKAIAFRFPPDTVDVLKKYHFDALSLANNHIFDMGQAGYDDTVRLLDEAGIANFGNPRDNAASSETMMVRGRKVAFLGLEEVVNDIDDKKAVEEIKRLVSEGNLVIPVVHWGVEYTHTPNARQRDLAHKFIDAGAVAVIGHHPHVVQAYETYNGRPIFYSLGNAVFDQYWSADTQVGMSVALTMSPEKTEIFFIPHKIVMSRLQLMDEKESAQFLEEFAGYGGENGENKEALAEGHLVLPAVPVN